MVNPWDACQPRPIAVDRIHYDADFNCRGEFTPQSVKELADSIRDLGRLIYPVLVQPWEREPGCDYRLIVGYRRYRAITMFLGWPMIPAIVCEGLTEHQASLLNVTENLERKNLNIWEEARALERLYPDGVTLRQAAKELKQTTHWVHVRLRLLRMPPAVQQQAAAGLLSQANLDALAGLAGPEEQVVAAGKIAEVRRAGTGKRLPGVERAYKRRTSRVRGRDEINRLVERMLEAGIGGLPPRVGAWCAGNISDAELWADIAESLNVRGLQSNT